MLLPDVLHAWIVGLEEGKHRVSQGSHIALPLRHLPVAPGGLNLDTINLPTIY